MQNTLSSTVRLTVYPRAILLRPIVGKRTTVPFQDKPLGVVASSLYPSNKKQDPLQGPTLWPWPRRTPHSHVSWFVSPH